MIEIPYKGEGQKYPQPEISGVPEGSGTDYSSKYVIVSASALRDQILGECANYCSAKLRVAGTPRKGSASTYRSCVSSCIKQTIAARRPQINLVPPYQK